MAKERKELIVLDGLTILFIVMLVVNGVTLALLYRWHNTKVFQENFDNRVVYGDLLSESRRLKNIIVKNEGAESWEKSEYGKTFAFRERGKKTYESVGVALDYPSDYVSETSEDGKHLILMTQDEARRARDPNAPPSEGPTMITVDTHPLEGKTLLDWLKTSPDANFNLGNGEYEKIQINDIPVLVYTWSGLYEATAYVVEGSDGQAVLATVTYITRGDDIVRDFDLVLSTLRKS